MANRHFVSDVMGIHPATKALLVVFNQLDLRPVVTFNEALETIYGAVIRDLYK